MSIELDVRICEGCGIEYKPLAMNQKFCSRPCKERTGYRRKMDLFSERGEWRTCEVCGVKFFTRRAWQKRCTVECGVWRKAKQGKNAVSILVTVDIPVFQHLQPKKGHIYDAEKCSGSSDPFYIVTVEGSPVIVRYDECQEIDA